jgi:hypothetical protein
MLKVLAGVAMVVSLVALVAPAGAAARHQPAIHSGVHSQVTDFGSQQRRHGRLFVRRQVPLYYDAYGPRRYSLYPYFPFYQPYPYDGPYYGLRPYFPFAPFNLWAW